MPAIDRSRPLRDIIHADGGRVIEYLDDPGNFYTADGHSMSDKEAAGLGVDLANSRKQAKIAELRDEQRKSMAEFEVELEKKTLSELEGVDGEDAQKIDPETIEDYGPNVFNKAGQLQETGKLKRVHIGGARFEVFEKYENGELGDNPISEGRLKGDEAVKFMLDWHIDNEGDTA